MARSISSNCVSMGISRTFKRCLLRLLLLLLLPEVEERPQTLRTLCGVMASRMSCAWTPGIGMQSCTQVSSSFHCREDSCCCWELADSSEEYPLLLLLLLLLLLRLQYENWKGLASSDSWMIFMVCVVVCCKCKCKCKICNLWAVAACNKRM